jgi:hypothetical protein
MKIQPTVRGNNTHKVKRSFGDPVEALKPNHRFIPVPGKFKKPDDFVLGLDAVLSKSAMDKITKAKQLIFHMVGDTGGINGQETQEAVAYQMQKQIDQADDANKAAFFYNLGDVVYYNGISHHYEEQFYDPYKEYPTYIFAIPGNHDCDTKTRTGNEPDNEESMEGFMTNFCDKTPSYGPFSSYRKTVNQPWPYWVLDTPYATIIGLFSNVDGSLDAEGVTEQADWLLTQLKAAAKDKCLIVTVHHPCYSLDTSHGGYPLILADLDAAFKKANRLPDAVFSGHVHNYQRFTRTVRGKKIPYVVAGAGGYVNKPGSIHRLQKTDNGDFIKVPFHTKHKDVVLNYYNQSNPGFLKITIDRQFIHGAYHIINFDGSKPPATPDDEFKFDWKENKTIALE